MRARVRWFDDEKNYMFNVQITEEVEELWVINYLKKRPELETYKYAMPGEEEIGIQYLEVFDINQQSRTIIDTERWEDQNLSADPGNLIKGDFRKNSSDYFILHSLNRAATKVELVRANTSTGETEIIFGEEKVNLTGTGVLWMFQLLMKARNIFGGVNGRVGDNFTAIIQMES